MQFLNYNIAVTRFYVHLNDYFTSTIFRVSAKLSVLSL